MLVRLTLEDFLFIKGQELEFEKGLNVITGETGTGKSLVLSSFFFLMGQEGEYPEGTSVEIELLAEKEPLVLRREMVKGRSRYFLNGRGSTKRVVEELLSSYVLFQGQNDRRKVVRADFQRDVYDLFAGALELRKEVEELYQRITELGEKLKSLREKKIEKELRKRLLQEEIEEVEALGLDPEGYRALKERLEEINLGEKINRLVYEGLSNIEDAYQSSYRALRALKELSSYRRTEELVQRLELFTETLSEVKRQLERMSFSYSQEELNLLNEKLYRVQRLERKHRMTYPELWERSQKLKKELAELQEEENPETLEKEMESLDIELHKLYDRLTRKRLEAKESFERKVMEYLSSMGLEKASFKVSFEERVSRYGKEQVKFLFSSFGGEGAEISQVASGGEVSRLSLALFMLLPPAQTYVLDEIDAGISGITSLKLARLLKELSKSTQLILVTHSPAVASAGDRHFVTHKEYSEGSVFIELREVKGEERLLEIARLMGKVSQKTIEGARELLREVCSV